MSPRNYTWVFDPDSGGKKIPAAVQADVIKRINKVAEENFKGQYTRLDIRFRGQFCYIDAYIEPVESEGWPPADWPETREEFLERLRKTPTHLCRLRYFGDDEWGFAFYTYSHDKYELSTYPNGEFTGKPEDAFLASAMYLNG
ncbi:hypothetical protein GW866_01120 [bacterium]|nr:hypothetical protein [bacterium]OIO85226.1 MAG: hypothetical protein AUK02_06705 [Anaerolineae bacterium CG2_30_58_95]PIW19967.1 MAG: hypothetical protein COW33_03855 [Anaerolineae bacterium CG17_big_fil_post_rev_8_21_14_2_50_57_27]